jgi:peptidoglycan/LPS O-acetylase OafA/YrhL
VQVRERLDILDGLRGIAILLVVWYHIALVSGQGFGPLDYIAQAGYLGVDLFFFISGFCLFYPYARSLIDGRPMPTVRRFFERRLMKIVPSYLLALAVFMGVYHAQFATPHDAVVQLLSHLTFMHTLSPATYSAISGPLWTIGVEVQFYLLFPLIVPWFRRSPVLAYLILAAVSEGYRIAVSHAGLGGEFGWINQLPAFLDVFGAGMLASYAVVALRARRTFDAGTSTAFSGATFAFAIVCLGAAAFVSTTSNPSDAHIWLNDHRIMVGPLCFALALTTYFAVPRWHAVVAAPALVFLSAISYNLYLWHLEIAVWLHNTGLPTTASAILAVPAAIGVAWFITTRFEQPILNGGLAPFSAALRGRRLPQLQPSYRQNTQGSYVSVRSSGSSG